MTQYRRKMPKPTPETAARLSARTMTDRQAKRLAAGLGLESKPSDYANDSTAEERRLRDARWAVEDMRIARELGI
jgi:hypothetical protein